MGVSTKSTSQLIFTAHHFWECCLANWVSTYLYILSVNPLPFNSGFSRSLWGGGAGRRETLKLKTLECSIKVPTGLCCVCSPSRLHTRAFLRTPAPVSFLWLQSLAAVCCVCLCVVVFVFLFSLGSQLHSLCRRSLFVWNACLFSSIAVVFCELLRLEERRGEWGRVGNQNGVHIIISMAAASSRGPLSHRCGSFTMRSRETYGYCSFCCETLGA